MCVRVRAYARAQHGNSQVHVPLYMCADPSTNFGSQCPPPPPLETKDQFHVIRLAWQLLLSLMSPVVLLYLLPSCHGFFTNKEKVK